MNAEARELLVISHGMPPTPRLIKLLKHLPERGWSVRLLTPSRAPLVDPRFAGPWLDGVATDRVSALRPISDWLRGAPAPRNVEAWVGAARPGEPSWIERLGRRLLLWTNTPDDLIGWIPFAVPRILRLMRRHPIRAVLASGPPFSSVLIGSLASRLGRRPLVADFRDAWVEDEDDPFGTLGGRFRAPYGRGRIAVLRGLERFCLGSAEAVFFTSHYTLTRYLRRYPKLHPKVELVLNGAEETDFAAPAEALSSFTFSHVGTLHDYQWRDVQLFLSALFRARSREPALRSARLWLAGHIGDAFLARLRAAITELQIADSVSVDGPMPYARAVSVLKGSGAVLLFAGGNRFTRLTKVSDAAASGRPVLALAASDGETARCVRDLGQTVYSGDSADELAAILVSLFQQGPPAQGVEHPFPFPYPHPANWRTGVEQIARRLDRIAGPA